MHFHLLFYFSSPHLRYFFLLIFPPIYRLKRKFVTHNFSGYWKKLKSEIFAGEINTQTSRFEKTKRGRHTTAILTVRTNTELFSLPATVHHMQIGSFVPSASSLGGGKSYRWCGCLWVGEFARPFRTRKCPLCISIHVVCQLPVLYELLVVHTTFCLQTKYEKMKMALSILPKWRPWMDGSILRVSLFLSSQGKE